MSKINVYGLGEHGINRVKSPIHVRDGELLSAQNATIRPIQAQLALTKRDGMAKINSSAAAGTLLAIKNIPITALPGVSWASASTGLTLNSRSIAWSEPLGMFVAVGDNTVSGNAIRSTDGVTWTAMTIASGRNQRQVIWSDGDSLFVSAGDPTVGGFGPISYSSDGINWTTPTTFNHANQTRLIAYSSTLDQYVTANATGTDTVFNYGTDLTNWTNTNVLPAFIDWTDCVWGITPAVYAACYGSVGGAQQIITSTDGITWTARTSGNSSAWQALVWSTTHSQFVAVASSIYTGSSQVMVSTDGVTWTAQTSANANQWHGICEADGGRLLAVSINNASGDQVMYSDNAGTTWTTAPAAANRQWYDVAFSPSLNMFVAIAFNGDPMYTT